MTHAGSLAKKADHVPRIYVTTRQGDEIEVSGPPTGVLMELLKDAGIDGIDAQCGGACACATCHIHVDESMLDRLAPIGADEKMLVSGLLSASACSRLSCQIPVTEQLDGLCIRIPPEA